MPAPRRILISDQDRKAMTMRNSALAEWTLVLSPLLVFGLGAASNFGRVWQLTRRFSGPVSTVDSVRNIIFAKPAFDSQIPAWQAYVSEKALLGATQLSTGLVLCLFMLMVLALVRRTRRMGTYILYLEATLSRLDQRDSRQ